MTDQDVATPVEGEVVPDDAPAPSTALAVQTPGALTELSVPMVVARMEKVRDLMRAELVDGVDYGIIPGTQKPTIYKSGAEKLCVMFRFDPETTVEKDWVPGGPHLNVTAYTTIYHQDGTRIAQGVGMCSTLESRYRYRRAARACPTCGKEAIIWSKKKNVWMCVGNDRGGCWANFEKGDKRIEDQVEGRVENEDVADQYNTVLKIASKRSFTDAVLKATGASAIFTQDLDDSGGINEDAKISSEERQRLIAVFREIETERGMVLEDLQDILAELFDGNINTHEIPAARLEEVLERVRAWQKTDDAPAPSQPEGEPPNPGQPGDGQEGTRSPEDEGPPSGDAPPKEPPAGVASDATAAARAAAAAAGGDAPWEGYEKATVATITGKLTNMVVAAMEEPDNETRDAVIGTTGEFLLSVGQYESENKKRASVTTAISALLDRLAAPPEPPVDDAPPAEPEPPADDFAPAGEPDPDETPELGPTEDIIGRWFDLEREQKERAFRYATEHVDTVNERDAWATGPVYRQASKLWNREIAGPQDLQDLELDKIWNAMPEDLKVIVQASFDAE